MKRSKRSLEQEEKAGKKNRNEHICWLIDRSVPQATVARHYSITRQRTNQIYKRGKKSLWERFIGWFK